MLLLLVDVYADRWQQFVGISKFTSSVRRRRERELLVATLLSVIAVHICVYYIIYGVVCVAPLSVALV